eukprot:TRINITY_DN1009_c0_g1_i1.p1 TRINITY_DN1009_c0_g1~~TRINITY_DN1009_c0_g1_i1.p1  ORF type:complete len:491 (+),score=177.68 TRINITY_DN1009_c0_g1_i1:339-1811(+)
METPDTTDVPPTTVDDNNNASKEEDKKGGPGNKKARGIKTPKGTQDYEPRAMAIRKKVFGTITEIFERHGAVTIDTPTFELKEILMGKYGEDSKLVFDLADEGGELSSLRYDLTVPFARYCAAHRTRSIKRYQIGKVYRRDNPIMTKGRFREFYQCDFDIAGEFDLMIPDAEAIAIMDEILRALDIGDFVIKINHRKILDGIFAICGVPSNLFRPICSAVDKLDKTPWDEVKKEMVEVKGLSEASADKIRTFVEMKGAPKAMYERLVKEQSLDSDPTAKAGLTEMGLLFEYLEAFGVIDRISFDFSLARGLDYYTGVIYEAITLDKKLGVGSIAAGGRYDKLIGIFGSDLPAVGISIGIERVFTIMENRAKKSKVVVRETDTEVFVASIDKGQLANRMKICAELWKAGIKAEFLHKANPKIQPQLNYADTNGIPLAIIFGQNEVDGNKLQLKKLYGEKNEKDAKQEEFARGDLVAFVQAKLNDYYAFVKK